MKSTRSLALGSLLLGVLSASARSAPEALEVAPYPTPAGYKTVKTAKSLKETPTSTGTSLATGYLGVVVGEKAGRPVIEVVAPDSPAESAGLKEGDVVTALGDEKVLSAGALREALRGKFAGDSVSLTVTRGGTAHVLTAKLKTTSAPMTAEERTFGRGGGGGWNDRLPRAWRKPTYNLAIIGVEYPDVKHNAKIADKDWEDSMFSLDTYTGKSATGQTVYGSMNDYYKELSSGKFKIEGQFVGWYEVSKKRMDYSSGSGTSTGEKRALLTEALELYTKKAGKDALKEFDGVFFLYAGARVQTTRGGLYWPHRANVSFGGRSLPYFIVQEGGSTMNDISVFCHEFGHMLGLPDLYARPELPGSEGVWQWCAMSNQIGSGRPQHFGAWSKEVLGWVRPTVIDPAVRQKLILSPIETDPTQCFKIKLTPDNSEYFLLEVRKKVGWDERLPGEGLLIWRVVKNKPVLEESHGVAGPLGPTVHLSAVPYPSSANDSFTPFTIPSSKSQLGVGTAVHITNIRRLPDGRVTFHIGYDFQ
ncbi:MAG TPA: M6 family metalloprotease domain-containing protein [Gemmata sp.]